MVLLTYYTIKTCKTCIAFEDVLRDVCNALQYKFIVFDIDADALASFEVFKRFKGQVSEIPFFSLTHKTKDLTHINLFSGTSFDAQSLIKNLPNYTND
jgi:hypothetical protein